MSVTSQVLKHSAIYSLSTLFARLIGFLMLPFYAYIFQTKGYGVIGVIDAALGALSILFAIGFHTTIVRFYHETPIPEKSHVVSTYVLLVWVFGLMMLVPIFVLGPQISTFLLGTPQYTHLVWVASITLVVGLAGQSASALLIIEQRSLIYSLLGIAQLLLGLSLNILLVLVLRVGLIGIFITSLVNSLLYCIATHIILAHRSHFHFDRRVAKRMLSYQAPLIPGELVAYFSRQAERFLVRFMISLEGAGILEMGYKFAPLLTVLVTGPFLFAWRTKNMELGDTQEARTLASRMFTRYMFLMAFAALLLAINIEDILAMVTPSTFWQAAGIAKIEIITTVVTGANALLVFGLLYQKKTKKLAIIKSTGAMVKIALSISLIYYAGLKGAAYSALVTEILLLAWIVSASQRVYPIPLEYARLSALICTALLLGIALGSLSPSHVPLVRDLSASLAPQLQLFLQGTGFAQLGGGKLTTLFMTQQVYLFSVLVKSIMACSYLGVALIVEPHLLDHLRVTSRMQSLFRTATSYIGIP